MRIFLCSAALVLVAAVSAARAAAQQCGQPVTGGTTPTASDALFVLQSAVGTRTCDPCVCDVNSSGGSSPITASDALAVLRRAVGGNVELLCPQCVPPCTSSEAPSCSGTCPDGFICGANPLEPSTCSCLNDCEASSAPTCGGSCAFAEPVVLECRQVTFTTDETVAVCQCLPPDLEFCTDTADTGCDGLCGPGTVCSATGDVCTCDAQPTQTACSGAAAPACGGTCAEGLVCIADNGACACLDATSHSETCTAASAPACAGACASGGLCAVDGFGACDCFDACEVSQAPACGGACPDGDGTCTEVSVNAGESDLHICQCR